MNQSYERSESEHDSSFGTISDVSDDNDKEEDIVDQETFFMQRSPGRLLSSREEKKLNWLNKREAIKQREQKHAEEHFAALQTNNLASDRVKDFTFNMIKTITGSFFQTLISVFACVVYVVNTYYEDDPEASQTFRVLEILIAVLFALDYMWGMYHAKDKKKFMVAVLNILDLMTILPVLISILDNSRGSSTLAFVRILRILRVIRILRLYRIFQSARNGETEEYDSGKLFDASEITRKILIICSTILALVFISTGLIHTLQKTDEFEISLPLPDEELTFANAFYFMVITSTTVGYGDMSPANNWARALIGTFIIAIIVILSRQTSELSELMNHSSQYRQPYKGEAGKHIVVTGFITYTTLYRFLKEFYHPDHDMPMSKCKVLIVQNDAPDKELLMILNHPTYEESVQYLEGNFLRDETLRSAALQDSRGVFILTDQYDYDWLRNDTYAVLAAKASKEFSPETKVFLQLVKPDFEMHSSWVGWEKVFSTWKFKMSILAANAFTPGFSTFISNLMISSSNTIRKDMEHIHWFFEYVTGISNEMYCVQLPPHLVGVKFNELVVALYKTNYSLLIGIQTIIWIDTNTSSGDQEDSYLNEIYLNPVDYTIREKDSAFIIASDQSDANTICNITLETITRLNSEKEECDPAHAKELPKLRTEVRKLQSQLAQQNKFFEMWKDDLRGHIWDHILVFGSIDHLPTIVKTLSTFTDQIICYVNDVPPDERWSKIARSHHNIIYLQCSFNDIEELAHTAINFAYHAILLTWKLPESSIEDSGVLPIVRILEENFTCPFTIELVDEVNMKYLRQKPIPEHQNLPFTMWPKYASSNVFFSSTLDFITPQAFHNLFIVDVLQKMIIYQDHYDETHIDENQRISSIPVPDCLDSKIVFGDVFQYLISLPRPVIPLGIYRDVGYMNNDVPYLFTAPDMNAPIIKGDKILVMGDTFMREEGKSLVKTRRVQGCTTNTIDFTPTRQGNRRVTSMMIRKETIAEFVTKMITEEMSNSSLVTDDEILENISTQLKKSSAQRDIINKQNQALLDLASEYHMIRELLYGNDMEAMSESESSSEEFQPINTDIDTDKF